MCAGALKQDFSVGEKVWKYYQGSFALNAIEFVKL
jgi:hypothetical protein